MQKHKGKDDYMVTKLNIGKTYDRVERSNLKMVMRKLGFNRQGDMLLLYPFLFLLFIEGLHGLII